ncbi:DUF502 domain-containing protein [Haloferula rosea]|uniref:DUF502 domain-containing protein n=1 Tax=Haloferula rosea TaxID=490093 RepID=A0A934R9M4_9BACT|nr:DUF502 domain-containing protein [Haloferula rosea]MBK1827714.1 DUF502 domain-containing protein [Haloferula rosea]
MSVDQHKHSGLGRAARALLAGVVSVIPVLATFWLLVSIYRILRNLGDGMIDGLFDFLNRQRGLDPERADPDLLWSFEFPGSNLVLALLPVLILFSVGLAVTNRPGRRLLGWFEAQIAKLPLLGFVYSSIKQLVDALRQLGSERKFKGVAFVEYPSPGCRLLGFITGNFRDPQSGKDVTAIFLPTAPNPLTGFVVIVEDERVMKSDLGMEEASKLILSAGLVSPLSAEEVAAKS